MSGSGWSFDLRQCAFYKRKTIWRPSGHIKAFVIAVKADCSLPSSSIVRPLSLIAPGIWWEECCFQVLTVPRSLLCPVSGFEIRDFMAPKQCLSKDQEWSGAPSYPEAKGWIIEVCLCPGTSWRGKPSKSKRIGKNSFIYVERLLRALLLQGQRAHSAELNWGCISCSPHEA